MSPLRSATQRPTCSHPCRPFELSRVAILDFSGHDLTTCTLSWHPTTSPTSPCHHTSCHDLALPPPCLLQALTVEKGVEEPIHTQGRRPFPRFEPTPHRPWPFSLLSHALLNIPKNPPAFHASPSPFVRLPHLHRRSSSSRRQPTAAGHTVAPLTSGTLHTRSPDTQT